MALFCFLQDNIVISGDKKGQVAIWDFEKVHERTVHPMNRALTNTIRCMRGGDDNKACSTSSDGTVKIFDLETVRGLTKQSRPPLSRKSLR